MRIIYILISFAFGAAATASAVDLTKASTGNLSALKSAFQSYVRSDGGQAEDIAAAIGKSVNKNPRNFLRALNAVRSKIVDHCSVIDVLGEDFVDDIARQKLELKARLLSVQSVREPSLRQVRTECETELEERLKQMSKVE